MSTSTEWQLDRRAAELYLEVLEPAILGPAADLLVSHVSLEPGDRVLDVGCGTGAVSLQASRIVGPYGHVVGVDVNRGMIDVARTRSSEDAAAVEWLEGSALDLPVPSASYDVVVSAQTLQFVSDRQQAASEMRRVLRPGGHAGASVWCALDRSPYFHALVSSISESIGADTAAGLRAAFDLKDKEEIGRLFTGVGFREVEIAEVRIDIDLPPVREFVPRHVSATPMAASYAAASSESRENILRRMEGAMEEFSVNDGSRVPFLSYFVMAVS